MGWFSRRRSSPASRSGRRRPSRPSPTASSPTSIRSPRSAAASRATSLGTPGTWSSTRPGAGPSGSGCSSAGGSRRRSAWWAISTTSRSGIAPAGRPTRRNWIARSSRSRRALAILLDMTRTHVPVLAGELIDLLDPRPGDTAIDCTFGDGGHARLVADRLGPSGTLICIDRDPAAEERFDSFSREVTCDTRFLRMDNATALEQLWDEHLQADVVYLDLGVSSMQIDTWERGFSYSYDAPLDMRMDSDQELDAREVVNTWDGRRLAQLFQRYGEERYARQIARAIARRRSRTPIDTTHELVDTIKNAVPAPARFGGGHPAKRVFQAIRIAVNDELGELDRALPAAWGLLREGGRLGPISFPSPEERRVKRFLADRARGCICPPDLPVCGCGRTPEAELVTQRAVAPTPGEVAQNPRSASGRLRAARKIEMDA